MITLGSLGSIIYAEGTFLKIPAYPPKDIVDATGCGDTYATGYLYMRNKGASYEEAGCFAAAMSTLKLEASGPFSKPKRMYGISSEPVSFKSCKKFKKKLDNPDKA